MKKSIWTVIFAITLIFGSQNIYAESIVADDLSHKNPTNSYYYDCPITPTKTPKIWSEFTSHVQMIDACEIDSDILSALSTYNLLETCIHYPLFGDALCYDDINFGFLK